MSILIQRIIFTIIILGVAYFALFKVWTQNVDIWGLLKAPSNGITIKELDVTCHPTEIELRKGRNRSIPIKITNHNNFPIFDAHLGICIDKQEPLGIFLKISTNNNSALSLPKPMSFQNRCFVLILKSIDQNDTETINIHIDGEKAQYDSRMSFKVYSWEKEPMSFDIPVTEDQIKDPPKHFTEFSDENIPESEKTKRILFQRIKVPKNPYLE